MSTVPRGAARAPHISLTYPGLPARPAGSAASHNDPEPVLAAGFERGAARAGAILAVPSARMERRARGRCAAMRPWCRRLAIGLASWAVWHTLCRRSCCRAAEGGRERRARRGRSSAARGLPKRASAGRPRRACRPRRRLLGAGSGASGAGTICVVMAKHSECFFATHCSVKIQVAPGSSSAPLGPKMALLECAPGMCMYSSQPDIVCVF